jgi:rare lipoprotein A
MNQKFLCTATALITTVLGLPSVGRTETSKEAPASDGQATAPKDVVKVGEYQSSQNQLTQRTVIAKIQSHTLAGRQAATLYIRNIPVLTFLGQEPPATQDTKIGAVNNGTGIHNPNHSQKVASIGNLQDIISSNKANSINPVWRATAVAAQINQLNVKQLDASKITVSWMNGSDKTDQRFAIKINGEKLVEINDDTRLADTTNNPAKDALQAVNRMRRLIGNAPPVSEIYGLPAPVTLPATTTAPLPAPVNVTPAKPARKVAVGPSVRITFNGMASWYGPGFHGNRTANGERYNQNAMTAAHRSLPFGTRVRVTNLRNGRSVIVRINDRGPFIRGRIIDLSVAAAKQINMFSSGVAPISLEVLSD